jgi:hypothetical protein
MRKACSFLETGLESGLLERVLEETLGSCSGKTEPEEVPRPVAPPCLVSDHNVNVSHDQEVDEMKLKARILLEEGLESGFLMQLLMEDIQRAKPPQSDNDFSNNATTHQVDVKDTDLSCMLEGQSGLQEPEESELKRMARNCLEEGLASGLLEEVLEETWRTPTCNTAMEPEASSVSVSPAILVPTAPTSPCSRAQGGLLRSRRLHAVASAGEEPALEPAATPSLQPQAAPRPAAGSQGNVPVAPCTPRGSSRPRPLGNLTASVHIASSRADAQTSLRSAAPDLRVPVKPSGKKAHNLWSRHRSVGSCRPSGGCSAMELDLGLSAPAATHAAAQPLPEESHRLAKLLGTGLLPPLSPKSKTAGWTTATHMRAVSCDAASTKSSGWSQRWSKYYASSNELF